MKCQPICKIMKYPISQTQRLQKSSVTADQMLTLYHPLLPDKV